MMKVRSRLGEVANLSEWHLVKSGDIMIERDGFHSGLDVVSRVRVTTMTHTIQKHPRYQTPGIKAYGTSRFILAHCSPYLLLMY